MNIKSDKEILDRLIGWRDIMNKKIDLERRRQNILQEIAKVDRRGRVESSIVQWGLQSWTAFSNECNYMEKYRNLFGLGRSLFDFPYRPIVKVTRAQFKSEVDYQMYLLMECYHPGKQSVYDSINALIAELIDRYKSLGLLTKEELEMNETTLLDNIIAPKYRDPPESLHIA